MQHQIQNFVRFCETLLKVGSVKKIQLITGYDDKTQLAEIAEKLEELKQSLLELDVELEVKLNPNLHDREIRLDTGWVIKIGRGLDFYQKPGSWFEVGANDLSLRSAWRPRWISSGADAETSQCEMESSLTHLCLRHLTRF
jgi:ATP-dependent Lon protease